MKNKNLKKFYSSVYVKKGENKHYTKLLFSKTKLPNEEREVLKEINWRGKTILDVGCGTGLLCYEIAKRGAKKVVGIDFAKGAIEVASRTYEHPRLKYLCEDIKKHRGRYDIIVSLGTLEHMDNPFSMLKLLKERHLGPGGSLVVTCPNWINPRGYMLQTLWHLFRARITLADIHYLTPIEFENWSKKLGMSLHWRTFDYDWAHGERLIKDFKRRIPNVLRDSKLPRNKKNIDGFISWIRTHILPLNHRKKFSGATGLYHFKKL